MSVAIQLPLIKNKIERAASASGRTSKDLKIVAVSKKVSADRVREAYALGVRSFAENYVQEFIIKKTELNDLDIDWHFIGHLQSNKVKSVVSEFNLIHSVDSIKIAKELSARSEKAQEILIEVNLAGEHSKSGCAEADLPFLIDKIQELDQVRIRGLMFMPPLLLTEDEQRLYFQKARELRDEHLKNLASPHSLLELSMGTSHDFEVAIAEGATLIRLGTLLFGQREN